MVEGVLEAADGWSWDVVTLRDPDAGEGRQRDRGADQPRRGARSTSTMRAAFGKPTKVVNDAVMQAIGSYAGGRMLFLGLGSGSALR